MPVNQNIYPTNLQVRQLPIFLAGIGGSEYQGHIDRPDGYCWNQLLYSAKGQGCLRYGATTVTLSEGWYFFLPEGVPHEYYPLDGAWEVNWVLIDGTACSQIMRELNLTQPICMKPADGSALEKLYRKMLNAQRNDKIYGDYTCSGLIYDYFLEFHRQRTGNTIPGGINKNQYLEPALRYIDEHFAQDFPLTILATQAGISSQHLCRLFKEILHMRPNEYLTCRRLSEAKNLLLHTRLPIADIGSQCGFPDAGYFSTVFKRYEGMSPAEYRRANL